MNISKTFIENIEADVPEICGIEGLYFDNEYEEIQYDDAVETSARIATGASKLVLIYEDEDVVCKVPAARIQYDTYNEDTEEEEYSFEERTDYCDIELDIYNDACNEGLEKAFVAIKKGIKIDNNQTYYAEKAEPFSNEKYVSKPENYKEDIRSSIHNSDLSYELSDYLWEIFVDAYGIDFCKKLSDFIDEHQINDICSRNCGMIAGRPVFLDYSGYFD